MRCCNEKHDLWPVPWTDQKPCCLMITRSKKNLPRKRGGNLYLWPELILTELTLANCCSVIPSKYRKVMKSASLLKTQEYDVSKYPMSTRDCRPEGVARFSSIKSYHIMLCYIISYVNVFVYYMSHVIS